MLHACHSTRRQVGFLLSILLGICRHLHGPLSPMDFIPLEWMLAEGAGVGKPAGVYRGILIAATVLSLWTWSRIARRDSRLLYIGLTGMIGAFVGAKILFWIAEGWAVRAPMDFVVRWGAGKSVLGALLGGYAGVEIAKKALGYQSATGDWFAVIVPFGIAWGRVGCWFNECCLGQPMERGRWWTMMDAGGIARWPAVPLEMAFNGVAGVVLLLLRRRGAFPGNLFHLYLMAYGLFRVMHEFVRNTPRMIGPLSGYAIAAVLLTVLGAIRFHQRAGDPVRQVAPSC